MKPVTIKNKVLSLGSGKLVDNYEHEVTGTGELTTMTINQILEQNQDAATYLATFVYCKLLGITITIIPSNVNGEVLANIRWEGPTIASEQELKQDNSTRRVPTNIRNYKNIFIKIPNITIGTTESYPIQLTKLINTNHVVKANPYYTFMFPGTLYLLIPEGVKIRVTVRMGYRQNDLSINSFAKSVKAELLKGKTYDQLIEDMQKMKIDDKVEEVEEEEREINDEEEEEKEEENINKLEKREDEKKIEKKEEEKEELKEEDLWHRDPLLDRKERWPAAKKREMKLKKQQAIDKEKK